MANKKKKTPIKTADSVMENWPQWVVDSLDDLVAAEEAVKESFFDGAPAWTDAGLTEMAFHASPTVKAPGKQSGPQFIGAFVGHQEWIIESDFSEFCTEEQLGQAWQAIETNFREKCKTLEPEQLTQAMKDFDLCINRSEHLAASFEKICELKKAAIKKCFNRATEQASSSERLEFLEAYTKARRVPIIKHPDQMAPRVKMLSALLSGWRGVEKMKNRAALREFLIWLLKGRSVYNSNFVNKVCADIQLKLAKRGAPKK